MVAPDIPILRTERLVLRAFTADDLDAYAAMQANPEVMRYLGVGETRTRGETWAAIAGGLGQWALRGYGSFAVEESATGQFVGRAGILHPYDWPGPELAYALDQPFWGRGYATEACREVLAWARSEAHLGELVSFIYPENEASKAVVRRLGAERGLDVTLMGIDGLECWHHAVPAT
ncbi:MAG: N-acetyltransferase [Chloroflexi bacterium]|nr:N-acetyltransferase [Chloroflexota bacterium]